MNIKKLAAIRRVAADEINATSIQPETVVKLCDEIIAATKRAEAAEAKLAALTFEPDWSKAPRLAKWWAVDEDGTAHWYWTEPTMGKHGWFVRGSSTHLVGTSQLAGHIELIGRDWWDTLRCKPGSTA